MASHAQCTDVTLETLKRELKTWEKSFSATHNGRKPGRDDIRNDASISAKYREYDRLKRPRTVVARNATPTKADAARQEPERESGALKERCVNAVSATPKKALKDTVPGKVDMDVSVQELEQTPAFIRCALGPTPHKDGLVLGIFDYAFSATPSKQGDNKAAAEGRPVISGTPTKSAPVPPSSTDAPQSATPQSSGKRRLFDLFSGTPAKRQCLETPSTSRRKDATPSFLRRSFPLAPLDEEASTNIRPHKKRPLVRSLSSIIQGLRKHEEERMDDDWDALNEVEAEERGEQRPVKEKQLPIEGIQGIEMPLGPDQVPGDTEEDDTTAHMLGPDGQPRKPWKKKGLKRQTRRVIMRPVMHKAKKVMEAIQQGDHDDDVVGETQSREGRRDVESDDGDTQLAASAGGGEQDAPYKNDQGDSDVASKSKKQPPSKSTKKKTSATAHANFRKLKIKNKNSKAKGRGGRGKFGRR